MRDVRVLFFGDSITAGVGDPSVQGWVGRVLAGAFAAHIPITAYNLGVRRDTSADVLKRWQAEARVRLTPDADCRVVFSFGANDTTIENGMQRVAPEESQANLAQVITEAAQLALPVLLVGPAPVNAASSRIASANSAPAMPDSPPIVLSPTSRSPTRCDATQPGRARSKPGTVRTPGAAAIRCWRDWSWIRG